MDPTEEELFSWSHNAELECMRNPRHRRYFSRTFNGRYDASHSTGLTYNSCHGYAVPGLLVYARVVDGPAIR